MYRINTKRTFKREVEVVFPAESGAGTTKGTLQAEFRMLSQSDIDDRMDQGDAAFLREVLVGVAGVGDEHGAELSADEARAAVLEDPLAVSALVGDYFEVTKGRNFRRRRAR